jgi:hypothetical protein
MRIKMGTNIVLDDESVEEAFKFSQAILKKKELREPLKTPVFRGSLTLWRPLEKIALS